MACSAKNRRTAAEGEIGKTSSPLSYGLLFKSLIPNLMVPRNLDEIPLTLDQEVVEILNERLGSKSPDLRKMLLAFRWDEGPTDQPDFIGLAGGVLAVSPLVNVWRFEVSPKNNRGDRTHLTIGSRITRTWLGYRHDAKVFLNDVTRIASHEPFWAIGQKTCDQMYRVWEVRDKMMEGAKLAKKFFDEFEEHPYMKNYVENYVEKHGENCSNVLKVFGDPAFMIEDYWYTDERNSTLSGLSSASSSSDAVGSSQETPLRTIPRQSFRSWLREKEPSTTQIKSYRSQLKPVNEGIQSPNSRVQLTTIPQAEELSTGAPARGGIITGAEEGSYNEIRGKISGSLAAFLVPRYQTIPSHSSNRGNAAQPPALQTSVPNGPPPLPGSTCRLHGGSAEGRGSPPPSAEFQAHNPPPGPPSEMLGSGEFQAHNQSNNRHTNSGIGDEFDGDMPFDNNATSSTARNDASRSQTQPTTNNSSRMPPVSHYYPVPATSQKPAGKPALRPRNVRMNNMGKIGSGLKTQTSKGKK